MFDGAKLKTLREQRNKTQEEVGDALCRTAQAIGLWETNKSEPSIRVLHKLSEYFGVEPSFFFSGFITNDGNGNAGDHS